MICHNILSSNRVLSKMENILDKLGLPTVFEKFKREKIDEKIALSLSDNELIRLGITTIGDRVRFRDLCQRESNSSDGASTSTSLQAGESAHSQRSEAHRERALLFNVRSTRRPPTTKKEGRKRTWTATFLCLSDRLSTKVPSSHEKQILQKAGLGIKKIQFSADDDEKAVLEKITSNEKIGDTGETCTRRGSPLPTPPLSWHL